MLSIAGNAHFVVLGQAQPKSCIEHEDGVEVRAGPL